MFLVELAKNALLHICLALWLLPLLYAKLFPKLRFKLNDKGLEKMGKKDFEKLKSVKEKNNSPSPNLKLSTMELKNKISFCKNELKIHIANQNRVMIGFKTAEIKDLEKKL